VYFEHDFAVRLEWLGNRGTGTSDVRSYGREHVLSGGAAADIQGSAAKPFRGDDARWNPEQLLIASLSQCHLLSYLLEAARAGVVVTAYEDDAVGVLRQEGDAGQFESVTLRPVVTISAGDPEVALALHESAARNCFIARSVNFPVHHEPRTVVVA
jgi:organic hydroperoxide reductase OsmC/OhrA